LYIIYIYYVITYYQIINYLVWSISSLLKIIALLSIAIYF